MDAELLENVWRETMGNWTITRHILKAKIGIRGYELVQKPKSRSHKGVLHGTDRIQII